MDIMTEASRLKINSEVPNESVFRYVQVQNERDIFRDRDTSKCKVN
jgi:hypothetical protein